MEINALLQVKMIMVGNYTKRDGSASFFLYGLGYDGNVYRLDDRRGGWVRMPMNMVDDIRNAMPLDEDE